MVSTYEGRGPLRVSPYSQRSRLGWAKVAPFSYPFEQTQAPQHVGPSSGGAGGGAGGGRGAGGGGGAGCSPRAVWLVHLLDSVLRLSLVGENVQRRILHIDSSCGCPYAYSAGKSVAPGFWLGALYSAFVPKAR